MKRKEHNASKRHNINKLPLGKFFEALYDECAYYQVKCKVEQGEALKNHWKRNEWWYGLDAYKFNYITWIPREEFQYLVNYYYLHQINIISSENIEN